MQLLIYAGLEGLRRRRLEPALTHLEELLARHQPGHGDTDDVVEAPGDG